MSNITKFREVPSYPKGSTDIKIYHVQMPDALGHLAIELAKQYAMVAARPDGEDSAGRSQMALLTPEEVSGRACKLAEELWGQFKHRGWLIDLPEPKLGELPVRDA